MDDIDLGDLSPSREEAKIMMDDDDDEEDDIVMLEDSLAEPFE